MIEECNEEDGSECFEGEARFQVRQEAFSRLVRDSPFGVFLIDTNLNVCELSRTANQFLGGDLPVQDRPVAAILRRAVSPGTKDAVLAQLKRTLNDGESYETPEDATEKWSAKFGDYKWYVSQVCLPDGGNGILCSFFSTTDVRAAAASAQPTVSRQNIGFELARMGVITIDYQSNEATLDGIAASVYGLPANFTVSRDRIHEQIHPEDRERVRRALTENFADGETKVISIEHRVLRPDGQMKWVRVRKKVYFESRDEHRRKPSHAVVLLIDITAQKEYEANLKRARNEAESANRARGQFLANMSHEIRTPMTAILGYADLLGDHLTDPDDRQLVDTIRSNGKFLLRIVNDILDLSKIDANKLDLEEVRVRPQEIMADVVSLMNVRAEENDVELIAQFDGKVPATIETDGKRLRQVLINLVSNAVKFTPGGTVTLTSRYDDDAERLVFEVSDTGVGIEPSELEELFDPFTQADSSNTRETGGTGLGLAISRRLTELLGGGLAAESVPEKGSTFIATIDPGDVEEVPFVRPPMVFRSEESEPSDIRLDAHVLIIDDRRDIRFLAEALIEQAGGTVETAADGRSGVDRIVEKIEGGERLDLVLLDMQMPVMDGFAAAKEIRSRGYEIPVVALTANAMTEDRQECLDAGCTDFISKPIDRQVLLKTIEKYCC